jgi:thymidylate synthase ThyX
MRVYLQKFDNQEVQARCCALFARSPKPLDEQAAVATAEQAQEFARTYVVGYGHNSINDCGSVCAAVERVSMLAAKFVEDYPLFNGQETSTRAIDFGAAPDDEALVSPFQEGDARLQLQRDLMAFYRDAVPIQRDFIAAESGVDLGSAAPAARRAVAAKSFDILRGFLPAGCRTQLAWITTLRQAADRIEMMLRHPLGEVREIGRRLRDACLAAHPGAFHGLEKGSHVESADAWYTDGFWAEYHYSPTPLPQNTVRVPPRGFGSARYAGRPSSKRVPSLADLRSEEIVVVQKIDYGSWRDIHRHRNCTQAFPLLTAQEFEPFYVDNLAPGLRCRAEDLVSRATAVCRTGDRLLDQYAIPMGFMVTYWSKWSVSQAAYVLELRSRPTVHPTVRAMVRRIADAVTAVEGCPEINCDWSDFPYTRRVKVKA